MADKDIRRLEMENLRLRETLEAYANTKNWIGEEKDRWTGGETGPALARAAILEARHPEPERKRRV